MAIIDKPSDYFNTVLWTGNATDNTTISGVGFQSDWTWLKERSSTSSHHLQDSVRGATKALISNSTEAENISSERLKSWNSDGFVIGTSGAVNQSSQTYVAWNWKAGTSFTNDASATGIGSIDSAGSVNTDAGFSIVTYTSTTGTVFHGLGVAPKVILMKATNNADQWTMGHASLPSWTYGLALNTTGAQDSNSAFWNSTAPTSTVFSQGSWNDGYTKVAYCFAEKQGYSKFGSYTGNGNADGTFVYLGFKPAWFMVKRTDSADGWGMFDNKRDPHNQVGGRFWGDEASAESTGQAMDFLSNGFKIRATNAYWNASGGTYIYMAFAENPFVTSTGVPATAR